MSSDAGSSLRRSWPAFVLGAIFLLVALPVLVVAGLNLLGQIIVALVLAPVAWLYASMLERPLSAISRASERMPKWLQWVLAAALYGLMVAFWLVLAAR